MSDFLKMFSNEGNNIIDFMPMTPSIVPMATGISTIFNDKPDSILDCHSFDTNILYDQMGNKVDVGISSMDQRTKMDAIIGKSGVDQVSFNTGGDGGSISTAIRPQQGQVDLGISTGDHSKTADLTLSKNGVEKVGYGTHGKDGSFDVSLFPHEEKMLISGSAKLDEIGSTELSGGALLDKDGRIDAQIGIEKSFDGAKIVALIRPGREEVEVRSSVDVDETGSTKITGSTILGPGGPSGGQIGFSKSLNPHSDIHGSAGFNRNNFEDLTNFFRIRGYGFLVRAIEAALARNFVCIQCNRKIVDGLFGLCYCEQDPPHCLMACCGEEKQQKEETVGWSELFFDGMHAVRNKMLPSMIACIVVLLLIGFIVRELEKDATNSNTTRVCAEDEEC